MEFNSTFKNSNKNYVLKEDYFRPKINQDSNKPLFTPQIDLPETTQPFQNDRIFTTIPQFQTIFPRKLGENTEIFRVKIKTGPNETITFSLGRFDDLFISFKDFCIAHKISFYLYKPLLKYIIIGMNRTFFLYNCELREKNVKLLNHIKNEYLKRQEEEKLIRNRQKFNQMSSKLNYFNYTKFKGFIQKKDIHNVLNNSL